MPKLKHAYAGSPHTRVIRAADFRSLGVEDQDKVEWSPKNKHVAELSEAAATALMELEPGDWELIDESGTASESGGDDDEILGSSGASRTTRRSQKTS